MTLLYATLMVLSAHALNRACGPELAPFTRSLRCEGRATDRVSGQTFDVAIVLHAVYLELPEADQPTRIITEHSVRLKQPVLKILSRTRTYRFLDTWAPTCAQVGGTVTCSGRDDDGHFTLAVDLNTMRAVGSYVFERYPNPEYHHELAFDVDHALVCR